MKLHEGVTDNSPTHTPSSRPGKGNWHVVCNEFTFF